jgi:hypothetical protein
MELIKKQIEDSGTLKRFTNIISVIDNVDADTAAATFEAEKYYFLKAVSNGKDLADCTPLSAMGVFLDVISGGLSFNPEYDHVYLKYRNTKIASGGKEKRLVYSKQPSGKVYQCQRAGSIAYVTKAVIVYEDEQFGIATNDAGFHIIRHTLVFPRKNTNIIAGYIYVVLPNGAREPFWMDTTDIDRLRGYSERDGGNSSANVLYSSGPNKQIDTGFFRAKLIINAVKPYSKTLKRLLNEVDDSPEDIAAQGPQAPTVMPPHVRTDGAMPLAIPSPAGIPGPADEHDGPF